MKKQQIPIGGVLLEKRFRAHPLFLGFVRLINGPCFHLGFNLSLCVVMVLLMGCNNPDRDYETAIASDNIENLQKVLKQYPNHARAKEAMARLGTLEWQSVQKKPGIVAVRELIKDYSEAPFANDAKALLDDLSWGAARTSSTEVACSNYIASFPSGRHRSEASMLLEEISWKKALQSGTVDDLKAFISRFPESTHKQEAQGVIKEFQRQKVVKVFKQGSADDVKSIDNGSLDSVVKELYGCPPLHLAVEYSNVNAVNYLISNGAQINARGADNSTALHIAARTGCVPIATLLMENKADIDSPIQPQMSVISVGAAGSVTYETPPPSAMNGTPLHWAAYYDKPEIVSLLIAHGANVKADDGNGLLPIHRAAQSGDLAIVRALVAAGSPLRTPEVRNYFINGKPLTPLHFAKSVDVAEYFVANGIGINEDSGDSGKPIHVAAELGHIEVTGYLIEQNVDVNGVCSWSVGGLSSVQATPLWVAAWSGNIEEIEFLAKKGGDIKYKANDGGTLLHAAAMNGHANVIKYLVERGLNLEERAQCPNAHPMVRGWRNITPLGVAANYGQLRAVQALAEAGADVNAAFEDKWNVLALAIVSRQKDVVVYLLEKGANRGLNSDIKNWSTTEEINGILKEHFKD
jgi:ankyrin repeat protein